jgi:acetyl-CoA carboxylase beta subunit
MPTNLRVCPHCKKTVDKTELMRNNGICDMCSCTIDH